MSILHTTKTSRFRKRCLALVITSVLSGCASLQQPGELSNEELKLSQYAAMTSVDAVRQLEQSYKSNTTSELPVYAPQHYSTAGKALHEAKDLLATNGPRDAIVRKVAVGQAMLKNADRVAVKVKENLSNELSIKNKLDSLNTDDVYGSEYGGLVDRLNKIIQSVEAGKAENSENREKLIKDMQRLEQKARRYNAMHEPEEILKRVKYRGGETLAPLTYKEAVEVFVQADEFIKQNPTYETGIEQIGKEALFAAKRALYITQEVAALGQKFNLSPEQIVLDEEYRLNRITREISDKDFRDHPLEVQSELLAEAAKEHAKELQNKDDLVIALRDTLINVRDSSSQLTSLSEETNKLKAEKSEWLAKDALYMAKIADLEERLAETITQLDQTQQKVLNVASTEKTKTLELDQATAKITELELLLTETQQKLQAEQNNVASASTNESKLTQDLALANKTTTSLEQQLAEANEKLKVAQLNITNSSSSENLLAQELELANINTKVLEQQLSEANQQLQALQLKVTNASSSESKLAQDLELTNKKAFDLEQKLAGANQKIKDIELQALSFSSNEASLKEKLEQAALGRDLLKQQLTEAKLKLDQAKENSLASSSNENKLVTDLEKAKATIANLNQELSIAKESAKQTELALNAAKKEAEQANKAIALAKKEKEEAIKTANAEKIKNQEIEENSIIAENSARVTKEETLQALESAKELLESIKDEKAQNSTADIAQQEVENLEDNLSDIESDIFVDATE